MNEIKKIHLGRQPFTISVEAHKALRDYLEAIERQTGAESEVSKEVELRMAELLTERGITSEKVILQEDVDFLKEQLGEPRDFKDEAEEEETESETVTPEGPRQLYRDPENGMIAGVAAGLAAYFNIDPLIVRLLFVVLTFASGAGVILYILLWILAPEAKTSSDRLRMRGKAVTVDSIKAAVDRADIPGKAENASRKAVPLMRSVVSGIGQSISAFSGSILTVVGSLLMVATLAATVALLTHGFAAVGHRIFPEGANDYVVLGLAALILEIIGLFMVLCGTTMVRRKWSVSGWLVATLAGILIVSLGVGSALGIDTVQNVQQRARALQRTDTHTLPAFTKLTLDGTDTPITYKPSDTFSLDVSYLGEIDHHVFTYKVDGDTLRITNSGGAGGAACQGLCWGYNDRSIQLTVHAPSLDYVVLKGTGSGFQAPDGLQKQTALTMDIDSSAYVHIDRVYPAALTYSAERNKGDNMRHLELNGLRSGNLDDMITIGEGVATLGRADRITLATDATCDQGDILMYLTHDPQELRVNDKTFSSVADFRKMQNSDAANTFNCIGTN